MIPPVGSCQFPMIVSRVWRHRRSIKSLCHNLDITNSKWLKKKMISLMIDNPTISEIHTVNNGEKK